MDSAFGLAGILSFLVTLVVVIGIGRIWMYSKQQVELLKEIRDAVKDNTQQIVRTLNE